MRWQLKLNNDSMVRTAYFAKGNVVICEVQYISKGKKSFIRREQDIVFQVLLWLSFCTYNINTSNTIKLWIFLLFFFSFCLIGVLFNTFFILYIRYHWLHKGNYIMSTSSNLSDVIFCGWHFYAKEQEVKAGKIERV